MTIKRTTGSILVLVALIGALWVVHRYYDSHSESVELETFRLEDGWGYKIVMNKKTVIYQPTIPAIGKERAFPNEKSARKAGTIVKERIMKHQDFALTTNDLIEIGLI